MRHINGAYTTYFNVKRKRAGHLFQGRYKAILVEADEYALELSRYIHLNPVRAGMVERPEHYEWSSFNDYVQPNLKHDWLCRELIWGLLGSASAKKSARYASFVEQALNRVSESPFRNIVASSLLGSTTFVNEITVRHLEEVTDERNQPALKQLVKPPEVAEIRAVVEKRLVGNKAEARRLGLYCCRQYSRRSLAQIGKEYGISDAGVSAAAKRISERLKVDEKLSRVLREVESELGVLKVEI